MHKVLLQLRVTSDNCEYLFQYKWHVCCSYHCCCGCILTQTGAVTGRWGCWLHPGCDCYNSNGGLEGLVWADDVLTYIVVNLHPQILWSDGQWICAVATLCRETCLLKRHQNNSVRHSPYYKNVTTTMHSYTLYLHINWQIPLQFPSPRIKCLNYLFMGQTERLNFSLHNKQKL
jgi:hypothetical protein